MKLKIDEVIDKVFEKEKNYMATDSYGPEDHPKFAIYMDIDFWLDCMKEITGEKVSTIAMEFFERDEILGHKVWRVTPNFIKQTSDNEKHDRYVVVLLDE